MSGYATWSGGGGGWTYEDLLARRILRGIFKVHSDQMLGQATVVDFVDAVEDKVDEIKSGEQCGWQVDVLWDRKIDVVF